jgi:channel protein (hemolysin III family)
MPVNIGCIVAQVISIPGIADPFSSLSHLLGAAIFAVFSVFLLRRGWSDLLRVVSLVIFCCGTVFLLVVSGLTHLTGPGASHEFLRRLDHAAIFFLIACSFTPMHVILFRGRERWLVLAIVWTVAVLGITFKTIYFDSIPPVAGTAMYIGMGWIGLISWRDLVRRYGFEFARPVMWGGLAYTIGAILNSLQWPVIMTGVIQSHEIFHVAVLIGLGCHWAFVYSIANRPYLPIEDAV